MMICVVGRVDAWISSFAQSSSQFSMEVRDAKRESVNVGDDSE